MPAACCSATPLTRRQSSATSSTTPTLQFVNANTTGITVLAQQRHRHLFQHHHGAPPASPTWRLAFADASSAGNAASSATPGNNSSAAAPPSAVTVPRHRFPRCELGRQRHHHPQPQGSLLRFWRSVFGGTSTAASATINANQSFFFHRRELGRQRRHQQQPRPARRLRHQHRRERRHRRTTAAFWCHQGTSTAGQRHRHHERRAGTAPGIPRVERQRLRQVWRGSSPTAADAVDISGLSQRRNDRGLDRGRGHVSGLAPKRLTVGGNNLSTEVSGVIQDGGRSVAASAARW